MTSSVLRPVYRAALVHDGAGLSDAELLESFLARRDEAFFEALVRRHGPMVLAVCRRILRNPHDADDAFQAAFLVLSQRASCVSPREMVANWLYGVAYRTALAARRAAARRRARERQVHEMPHPHFENEETWQELLPLLDRELNRLPAKYRAPVVLCHLEGRTRKEAALQLCLPVGTLSGRLTTAMRLLAKRMRRHGLVLSGTILAAALTPNVASASVPAWLIATTMKATPLHAAGQATVGVVSAEVVALSRKVVKSMLLAKLKLTTAALLTVAVVGGGTGVFAYRAAAPENALASMDADSEGIGKHENLPQLPARRKARPQTVTQAADDETINTKTDAKKSDREQLQGTWIPIASVVDGQKKDPADPKLQQWKLFFEGDRVTIPDDRTVRFTVDADKNPKELDIMGKDDAVMMRVIYQLEGDKLTVSFKKNGERPTDFDTVQNKSVLIVLKRRVAP
jgi:RNA polymerase sigma-70 factor (ECF subfamily)